MNRKSKVLSFALVMVLGFTNVYSYAKLSSTPVEQSKVQSNQQIIVKNFNEIVKTSDDINIENLRNIRDNLVEKNYNDIYLKRVKNSSKSYQEYYNGFVKGDFGLDSFFERRFCKKKVKEIYKKEIELLEYYNNNDIVFLDVAGSLPNTYKNFELFQYRKNFNDEKTFKRYDLLSKSEKEKLYTFYFNNIDSIVEETDSDVVNLVDAVYPETGMGLDSEFVFKLQEKYKDKFNKYKFDRFEHRMKDFDKEIEVRSPLKVK